MHDFEQSRFQEEIASSKENSPPQADFEEGVCFVRCGLIFRLDDGKKGGVTQEPVLAKTFVEECRELVFGVFID